MIKIKSVRQIIIGFIIFAVVFYLYSDKIAEAISSLNPFLILLAMIILNPVYLIFIIALFEIYGFRGVLAGLLISVSADLISLPHILTKSGGISEVSWKLMPETTFWNVLPEFLKNSTGVFLVYIIISVLLVILALMIAHKKNFKSIFIKSI